MSCSHFKAGATFYFWREDVQKSGNVISELEQVIKDFSSEVSLSVARLTFFIPVFLMVIFSLGIINCQIISNYQPQKQGLFSDAVNWAHSLSLTLGFSFLVFNCLWLTFFASAPDQLQLPQIMQGLFSGYLAFMLLSQLMLLKKIARRTLTLGT